MPAAAIDVRNVCKTYHELKAVDALSFSVAAGTCYGLLGPNGAGKTTMMKMLYGKAQRDRREGSVISVFGYDPASQELQIKYFSGMVPQENNLDDELNVEQNLIVFSKFYGIQSNVARRRIDELLGLLELSEKRDTSIRELSGGMKRRLVIARALLNNPRLLFLDEPTTGLDPQVRHAIWEKLRLLKKQGLTILLTTHYMEEAFQICDSVAIMEKGKKVVEGAPYELVNDTIERYVLEIRGRTAYEKVRNRIDASAIRVDLSLENVLCYATATQPLQALSDHLEAGEYYLRESNLEDVFLKTTGRALNERQ